MESSLAAIALGRRPTVSSRTLPASNVSWSKRCTLESAEFETQTEPKATRTSDGPSPATARPASLTGDVSTRASVESPNAAQTEPGPTATPASVNVIALSPSRRPSDTRSKAGSTRYSVPSRPLTTQTAPAPAATPSGVAGSGTFRTT